MTDAPLVLSLFPGIGLLDMAFELEGFCVVAGPDVCWGRDIRGFRVAAGRFDGIIGGPPCQPFSTLVHLVRASGREPRHSNLIPEYERIVAEARPAWFVMEEVPRAPEPVVPGYAIHHFVLANTAIAGDDGFGQAQMRVRRFSFGLLGADLVDLRRWIDYAALELPDAARTVVAGAALANDMDWKKEHDRQYQADRRERVKAGAVTSAPVNNSQEAKGRVKAGTVMADYDSGVKYGHEHTTKQRAVKAADWTTPHVYNEKQMAVTTDAREVPVKLLADGSVKKRAGKPPRSWEECCELQGLPPTFLDEAPFTKSGKFQVLGNGVPLPMGRAIAKAVRRALGLAPASEPRSGGEALGTTDESPSRGGVVPAS